MMASSESDQSRTSRLTTHTTHLQKQPQATAVQVRLAQADSEEKVKQLVEVTGRSQDECLVALHDHSDDVVRAINFLLEEATDQNLWEMVGRKRVSEVKRGERRGHFTAAWRGRATSRSREGENGGRVERGAERGRRGRSRGAGGRGRDGGGGLVSFSSQKMGMLNPSDGGPHSQSGHNEAINHQSNSDGCLRDTLDDWATDDWSEDLSETKEFTSSTVNTPLRSTHRLDLASVMASPDEGAVEGGSETPSWVFTNSQHKRPITHTYAHAAASTHTSTCRTHVCIPAVFGSCDRVMQSQGGAVEAGVCKTSPSNTHLGVTAQQDPSVELSQHTLQQPAAFTTPSPPPQISSGSRPGPDTMVTIADPPNQHLKGQRRRAPLPSKIPSSAVEMPGSADVSKLNVQFGALDFVSEPISMEISSAKESSDSVLEPAVPVRPVSEPVCDSPVRTLPASSAGLPSMTSTSHRATPAAVPVEAGAHTAVGKNGTTSQHDVLMKNNCSDVRISQDTPLKKDSSPLPSVPPSPARDMSTISSSRAHDSTASVSLSSPSICDSAGAPGLVLSSNRPTPLPSATGNVVPPLVANQYILRPGGLLPAYSDYYGVTFPATTAAIPVRDGGVANNLCSGESTKVVPGDSSSPAPPTTLPSPTQAKVHIGTGPQVPAPGGQTFVNTPLPPGYGYPAVSYYPPLPSALQYPPLFMTPTKQANQYPPPSYGFDDLSQGREFSKGYGCSAQTQSSPSNSTIKGGSVTADVSSGGYSKTQSFEKAGFHTAMPPHFNLPSALGGATAYSHTSFVHILPAHQQPHLQRLQTLPSQCSQNGSIAQKNQNNKNNYSSSAFWAN
ncbi:ubiquitin-associated protein 2-like isoform X2 [Denticeps clupeoides]|uniref:ubiquitin-associated protein 2-like isoform X2 n=1 Tax=Denticeps clupeoides TaxID=299321 RepID=UPI0010A4DE62|nr:ubiquitin-associated protein 2-like isoform X2 [Denticeps clupeoides]